MTAQITVNMCPACGTAVMPGDTWCANANCKRNIIDPSIGRLAMPGQRLAAFVLDVIVPIVLVIFGGFNLLLGFLGALTGHRVAQGGAGLLTLLIFGGFIAYVVWCFMLFGAGQTPGKFLMKLRVVKADGSTPGFFLMLVREWVGKYLSGFVFGLGWFFILFDKANQGWHDKLVATYVINVA